MTCSEIRSGVARNISMNALSDPQMTGTWLNVPPSKQFLMTDPGIHDIVRFSSLGGGVSLAQDQDTSVHAICIIGVSVDLSIIQVGLHECRMVLGNHV